jgi:hypothetical protein
VLFGGIVSQLMEKAPTISNTAMAALPTPGAGTPAAERFVIPELQIGAGDYLFLGLLFAALHRNQMDWRGARRWTIPLIILALVGVAFTGMHLPGLVFIGLGVAIPNWKFFEYTRDELFALLYAGIFVVILTVALYFGITSQLPERPPLRPGMRGGAALRRGAPRRVAPPAGAPAKPAPATAAP